MTAAYLNNPTLLGQRAKARATDEQVLQVLSNWRPTISLSGSISRSMTTNKAAALGNPAVLSAKFERKAQVGSWTVLEVLDAEQEFLDSGVAHVSAQRGELVAVFELKATIGRLTAKELKLPVKAYDPDDHYRKVRDKWFGGSPGGGE